MCFTCGSCTLGRNKAHEPPDFCQQSANTFHIRAEPNFDFLNNLFASHLIFYSIKAWLFIWIPFLFHELPYEIIQWGEVEVTEMGDQSRCLSCIQAVSTALSFISSLSLGAKKTSCCLDVCMEKHSHKALWVCKLITSNISHICVSLRRHSEWETRLMMAYPIIYWHLIYIN